MIKVYIFLLLLFFGCEKQKTKNMNKKPVDVLYLSALDAGYDSNFFEKNKTNSTYKKIIASKHLQNVVSKKISIPIQEINNYYKTNKESFITKNREVLFYRFNFNDEDSANFFVKSLSRLKNGTLDNKFGVFIDKYKPTKEVVVEKNLKEVFRSAFFKKPHKERVFGPKQINGSYIVFYIIKIFNKNMIKDLIYVQDDIYKKIYITKSEQIKKQTIDSLLIKYANN